MPLVVLNDFLIRKGHGLFNIHEFIEAMLSTDSVEDGYAALRDSHHDLNHDNFAGVEADAVKLASNQGIGGLTPQDIEIINQGEAANPQAWHQAFQKAVNVGAPLINEAIAKTNEINKQKNFEAGVAHRDIPMAFEKDMGNYVAVQAWRQPVIGSKNGQTHNPQGALITQYKSALTGKPEAYARPYGIGLQVLRKEKYPDLKMPKASDEINPRIIHGDSIYIRDGNLRSRFGQAVQNIKMAYPNAPPDQLKGMALQALRNLPEFDKFGGIRHSSGLQYGNFSEGNMQQRVTEQKYENADSRDSLLEFIPPEARNHSMYRTTGNSYYHKPEPSPAQMKFYGKHFGWDEEKSREVHQNAYSGKYDHISNSRDQLMAAKRDELLASGKKLDYLSPNAVMPRDANIPSPVDEQQTSSEQPKQSQQPNAGSMSEFFNPTFTETPIQEAVSRPPPLPIQPPAEPPKQNQSIVGALPAPQKTPTPPISSLPQKPPAPPISSLNAYPSRPTPNQSTGRGFLDNLMSRLGYAYETLFPSFGKADFSNKDALTEMLENVQLEIAKKEMNVPYQHQSLIKSSLSIKSIEDVTKVGNTMKRPNSDIITVFHSRGDWDNLAKSFDMTKIEVQMVKVIFNE